MRKKQLPLEVIHRYAAGIDVGSRFHYVAIGQKPEDVKEFGVYNEDLLALVKWLKENKITTVAMESTGTNGAKMLRSAKLVCHATRNWL